MGLISNDTIEAEPALLSQAHMIAVSRCQEAPGAEERTLPEGRLFAGDIKA
jgi:hypothetical protein